MRDLLPIRLVHVELFEIYTIPVIDIRIKLGEPFDEKICFCSRQLMVSARYNISR